MPLTGFSRRRFLQLVTLALAGLPWLAGCGAGRPSSTSRPDCLVYVSTYAEAEAESIFLYRLGTDGTLTQLRAEKAGVNPSFITLDARHQHLYAANEVGQFEGAASGFVSTFSINQQTGQLTPQGRQASGGADPCYVSLSPDNRAALVANYTGGSVALLPLAPDGQLGPATATDAHRGAGPNRERQEKPHAHCIIPDPAAGLPSPLIWAPTKWWATDSTRPGGSWNRWPPQPSQPSLGRGRATSPSTPTAAGPTWPTN
ncbi:hypothetical protein CDA63_15355 [Hymenobacter amundsenii]|uniref:6-phosphogluconolactonase n=1 Tax=Hymenobacter amundsenii TaxID=2006685 RepID=A0A246FKT2_9BACT|nr:hypothetical protein CDA63_15355 [Hymenobacter amundsenii]